MNKPIAAVDIDLTCVDIGATWWQWMNAVTNSNKPFPKGVNIDYNLSAFFESELRNYNVSGFDYFRQTGMYDLLQPLEGCVYTLKELSNTHNIVFVSKHKGHHSKSKCYWVKRHFPFYDGIILTDEKHFVHQDIFIDDRVKYHNKSDASLKIVIDTPYTQDEDPVVDATVVKDWSEVYALLVNNNTV